MSQCTVINPIWRSSRGDAVHRPHRLDVGPMRYSTYTTFIGGIYELYTPYTDSNIHEHNAHMAHDILSYQSTNAEHDYQWRT